MKIIFPSDTLNTQVIENDQWVKEEEFAAKTHGFETVYFNHDEFTSTGKVSVSKKSETTEYAIYRGWMLTPAQYRTVYRGLKEQGYELINNPEQYEHCHYFPNVYPSLKEFTPDIVWFEQYDRVSLEGTLRHFNSDFILKDYVKSEKTDESIFLINGDIGADEMMKKLEDFKKARGPLFNKGFVFKKYVDLEQYSGEYNEYRLFFLDGQLLSESKNSNVSGDYMEERRFSLVEELSILVADGEIESNYFTIDIAQLEGGQWIVVEAGDGQVSGLASGENSLTYYANLRKIVGQDKKELESA